MTGVLPSSLAGFTQFIWLIQLALAIHVYRSGRPYWWIWVLFVAPVLGGLAYLVVEVLPELNAERGLLNALKPRAWRTQDLRRQLEETDTIDNRLNLAEELYQAGALQEAAAVSEECLQGVFKDDPHTLAAVAKYRIALGDAAGALELLRRAESNTDRTLEAKLLLLRGDACLALQRYEDAEAAYQDSAASHIGEAARFGLAEVYASTGRMDQAKRLWMDIQAKYRKAGSAWRRTERPWYRLAATRLKASKAAAG